MIASFIVALLVVSMTWFIMKSQKQQLQLMEELASTSIALYNYDQYYVAAHKLNLCFLEDHIQDIIKQLIRNEKYENIRYYQDILKTIQQMKQMDNSKIESLNDD